MKTVMLIENNERAGEEVSAQLSWSFCSLFLVGPLGWGWGDVIGRMGYSSSHGDNIVVEYDSYDWLL